MKDINRLFIEGRVTRDLKSDDFRSFSSGLSVLRFSIATNRSARDGEGWKDEVSFFDVSVFGKQAENLKGWLSKGSHVFIEGSLKQERWEDKQTKQTRSAVRILADLVKVERKAEGSGYSEGRGEEPSYSNDEFEDDIPF